MNLVSVFETRVNIEICERLVSLGRFSKNGTSLALGSSACNVEIISPFDSAKSQRLAINREITAIARGVFDTNVDVILIGTTSNLLAYNVLTNSDLFYVDVPDGVNAMLFSKSLPHIYSANSDNNNAIAIVGGNCSIQAFDCNGNEVFWTVTSDNVTCMELCDIDNDGIDELLIGSQDCTIRAFRGEQVIFTIAESDIVTNLQRLGPSDKNAFAYSLKNGTVGVFRENCKLWNKPNRERVTSLNVFMECLIVGWSNGCVESRTFKDGEVIWSKFVVDSDDVQCVAAVVIGNLRSNDDTANDKEKQLITVSTNGLICAWQMDNSNNNNNNKVSNDNDGTSLKTNDNKSKSFFRKSFLGFDESSEKTDNNNKETLASTSELNALALLTSERDRLENELFHIGRNYKTLTTNNGDLDPALISPKTQISCTLTPSTETRRLLLVMNTNNCTVIKTAVIYGDGVFENGSFMLAPTDACSAITLPLKFEKDLQCTLAIKAVVGHLSSQQNHVFELSHKIPKFASYLYVPTGKVPKHLKPTSYITFTLPERLNRLILWLNQAFLLEYEANTKKTIDISFVSLRNEEYLTIIYNKNNKSEIQLFTDNLTLAGDIIQDICQYLSIKQLESVCCFKREFKVLERELVNVREFNDIRNRLSVDIASNTAIIKNEIVCAEDSRIQRNYSDFRKHFSELFMQNQNMCQKAMETQSNHTKLIASLKQINQGIQKISRFRVGKFQKQIVVLARQCVKNNNATNLVHVLQFGNV